jgi:hypothetical protein
MFQTVTHENADLAQGRDNPHIEKREDWRLVAQCHHNRFKMFKGLRAET